MDVDKPCSCPAQLHNSISPATRFQTCFHQKSVGCHFFFNMTNRVYICLWCRSSLTCGYQHLQAAILSGKSFLSDSDIRLVGDCCLNGFIAVGQDLLIHPLRKSVMLYLPVIMAFYPFALPNKQTYALPQSKPLIAFICLLMNKARAVTLA